MSIRAFELVPVIERIPAGRSRLTIESIECCGRTLYLGTNDSYIIQYQVEESTQANGKVFFKSIKQREQHLGLKKPVQNIKAASALNRLLVDCDATLFLINMFDLEPVASGLRIRAINCFAVNENPTNLNPFSIQVCAARRKQLSVYNICNDKATANMKDIHLSEPPVTMAMDGKFVCAALATHYVIVNCELGHVQDLFPYDVIVTTPFIKRISKEEFLLNSPGALGMFVTTAGISERPPIHWSENLVAAAYNQPYVLSMDTASISVYSILDQQSKQILPFQGGCLLGNFDGRVYGASFNSVYSLVAVPWERQVQSLLAEERIEEALKLAEHANHGNMTKEHYYQCLQRFHQQAGFIEFSRFNFNSSRELFKLGNLDVRELICLFPNILPSTSSFTRTMPSLHHIADVHQMCQGNEENLDATKHFLIEYLEDVGASENCRQEVDTALLKLYAEKDPSKLMKLLSSLRDDYTMMDCSEWFERYRRHNAVALHHHYLQDSERALSLWVQILSGKLEDSSFAGLEFLVEFLSKLEDLELVWKYAGNLLDRDEELAVKIFTERLEKDINADRMKPDVVVEFLHSYPKALLKYLEYVVIERNVQKEHFHTHLAVMYLDKILGSSSTDVARTRKKLHKLLELSSLCRIQLLLGKIKNTELYFEKAIMYGKLEQHEKALKILVHQLKDPEAAHKYCVRNSTHKDQQHRCQLFHTLLSVYLNPEHQDETRHELLQQAVELLNSEAVEFDVGKVLQMVPSHWSVGVLERFLQEVLRASLHSIRSYHIQRYLRMSEYIQIQFVKYDALREPIVLTDNRTCSVCSCPFSEPTFSRHPNGTFMHVHCSVSSY